MGFFNPQIKTKRIRLKWYAYKKLTKLVSDRDSNLCRRCGAFTEEYPHHIIFRSHNGSDVEENLIILCKECHSGIHDHYWIECSGDANKSVFELTLIGEKAVKDGKLRPEIKDSCGY